MSDAVLPALTVTTARGIQCRVVVHGDPDAPGVPLVYLHGADGLGATELLHTLSRDRRVYAPVWPGYGEESGEELLTDMLDFALHGWDVVAALRADVGLPERVHLAGHCMGAMIAAEMACLAPMALERLVLVDPLGLWLDDHPIPDLFSLLPFEFARLLFADAAQGAELLTGGLDFEDRAAIERFLVRNSRRLGTAGKILFPVPNRRLSKRLYRLTAPTLLVWGEDDRLVPTGPYAAHWAASVPHARTVVVPGAGHMTPVERPGVAASHIGAFLQ